ncbi:polysaccharide deacetylase family protein [Rothia sp. CCM 9416]|uniref:polysaccharide deacetylase family protein n=1 Tax=Rothia sp. CCM 9416 TaxID=3402655 RepID=UPI003AE39D4A
MSSKVSLPILSGGKFTGRALAHINELADGKVGELEAKAFEAIGQKADQSTFDTFLNTVSNQISDSDARTALAGAQAAISAEQSARESADAQLEDRIFALETNEPDLSAYATKEEVGETAWAKPGELSASADIHALSPGAHTVPNREIAKALELPEDYPGILTYYPATTKGGLITWQPLKNDSPQYIKRKVNGEWSSWGQGPQIPKPWVDTTALTAEDNLDTLPHGMRVVTNRAVAKALSLPSVRPGSVETVRVVSNAATQRFHAVEDQSTGTRVFVRDSIQGVWSAWRELAFIGQTSDSSDVIRHDLLKQGLSLRKGSIGTGGVGAVSLRFDDAPEEFVEKVLPMLIERRLPFTRVTTTDAIGSRQILPETFPEMESYCINYGGEVFNHGREHTNVVGQDAIYEDTVGALHKLRELMPRIAVDCYSPPGGAVTYDGHMPSNTVSNFADTFMGRTLFAHHALVTGYMSNSYYRHLDGVPRDGFAHRSCDTSSLGVMKSVTRWVAQRGAGMVAMFHANNIGTSGYISMADFTAYLDYLVEERAAGRLLVLTVTGLVHANASHSYRTDFLASHESSQAFSESLASVMWGFKGATVELVADVVGTPGSSVVSSVAGVEATHVIPSSGVLKLRQPVTVPLDHTPPTMVSIDKPATNVHLYTC